jgi:serine/threonine protein kinase
MSSRNKPQPPSTGNSGKIVGGFELLEKIGSGSFSTVYRGKKVPVEGEEEESNLTTDPNLEELVAVKAIHLNRLNPKLKQAMFDEVEILNRLTHPNIVR